MIIGSSSVQMGSARKYETKEKQRQTAWIAGANAQKAGSVSAVVGFVGQQTTLSMGRWNKNGYFIDMLKSNAQDGVTAEMEQSMLGRKGQITSGNITSMEDRVSMKQIREHALFYLLRHLNNLMSGRVSRSGQGFGAESYNMSGNAVQIGTIQNEYSYEEQENTAFSTKGKVVTADGREIEFNLDLEMSRRFEEYYYKQNDIYAYTPSQSSNLVDPLVINLDSNIANVSDQKFMFDIDADGILDSISQLNSGSGYLALDKNGDGIINDGSELFGTKSGNGFADLAAYDDDGNGWIDENDAIWSKLLIWTKDEHGKDV
ncbi:MAG: hypothetical protein K2K17_05105, partial [Lachnospiraceae bacterium]|nr:hypothetical protein [Lachnospiraceae bacterium]